MHPSACTWDVVIVGAGPAGAATALAITRIRSDLKILLIDAKEFPRDKSCGDAVSPASVSALDRLDALDVLRGYSPNSGLRMRGPSGGQAMTNGTSLRGRPAEGFTIPRLVLDDRLLALARARGAQVLEGLRYVASTLHDGWRLLDLEGRSEPLTTRLLIGADGAYSRVRTSLGLRRQSDSMTAVATRAYAEHRSDGAGLGPIDFFFMPELLPGYAWRFPIDEELCNIGVAVPVRTLRDRGLRLNDLLNSVPQWLEEHGYGSYGPLMNRQGHLLPHAPSMPALDGHDRATLVGDSACMINAFTGEGISYALNGGLLLATALGDADFGSNDSLRGALRSYSRAFHARYDAHFRSSYRLQRLSARKVVVDLGVRSARTNESTVQELYDLLFCEGHLSLKSAARLAGGLLSR